MKIVIFDIYRKANGRISKDTNGGYGTVNDFGDALIPTVLKWIKSRSSDWPPLSSVYSAAVLRERGCEVEFVRELLENFSPDLAKGADICLVTSSIVCCETELTVVKVLKQAGHGVGVIGQFAESNPDLYIEAGAFVIKGEPEFFLKSLDSLESLKSAEGLVANPKTANELDELPMPAWDMINTPPKYNLIGKRKAFLPIHATRGCPYSCRHYCTYPLQQGPKVRLRSPEKILEEMAHWQDQLGVSFFMFRDPVFSINKIHTKQFCETIINSGRKFNFVIETHLNNLPSDLVKLLKKAGLVMVKVGIESSSAKVLDSVSRFTLTKDKQIEKINFLQGEGINVSCFYMIGMPSDTEDSCHKTIQYAKYINSYGAQFSVFTPYPGTPVFKEYEAKIIAKTFQEYTQWDLVFQHEYLTPQKVRELLNKAYSSYYTNPYWGARYLMSKITS